MTKPRLGENEIQRDIMVAVSQAGTTIFRNNVGQANYTDRRGKRHVVVYGLHPGSSDLIGWTPIKITENDVGRTVAVFTALEVKVPGKNATKAQANFIEAVRSAGGISRVVRSVRDAVEGVTGWRRARPAGPRRSSLPLPEDAQ